MEILGVDMRQFTQIYRGKFNQRNDDSLNQDGGCFGHNRFFLCAALGPL